jgi:hypothetical protein
MALCPEFLPSLYLYIQSNEFTLRFWQENPPAALMQSVIGFAIDCGGFVGFASFGRSR